MIYLHSDTFSNFSSASRIDGNNLTIDLFSNELSDLIIGETPKLVDTLNKVGVKVDLKMSDEEIVDKVIEVISQDEKVVKAIGYAIADANGIISNDKSKEDLVKSIDTIVAGLTPAAKEITESAASKAATKSKIMKQIETKAKMKGNYTRTIWKSKKSSKAVWVIGGLVVLGVCGYIVYKRMNKPMAVVKPLIV